VRPGLPDPAPHNALLEQYSKAIEELAKEKGARFVSLQDLSAGKEGQGAYLTENGIHIGEVGYQSFASSINYSLGWRNDPLLGEHPELVKDDEVERVDRILRSLRAAVLKKNDLFFHRFRPENATYLFGFRKHEQGQNAVEIPKFDPLIEAADAEIDRLKQTRERSDLQIAQIPADSKDNARDV
jgi:hypothetical protein